MGADLVSCVLYAKAVALTFALARLSCLFPYTILTAQVYAL